MKAYTICLAVDFATAKNIFTVFLATLTSLMCVFNVSSCHLENIIIVNSYQCVGQYQLQVFTVRAQKADLLLYNVVGSHTCGALGCLLCSGSECAFHPD